MQQRRLWCLVLLFVIASGCNRTEEPAAPAAPPEDPPERLGDKIDTSLSDLLGKPRSELAALADEWAVRAQMQEKHRREAGPDFGLLPQARFPLIVPVLRQAVFGASAGFSLPPYIAEGSIDSDLARHLARYGDDEAARKLVDPKDDPARQAHRRLSL